MAGQVFPTLNQIEALDVLKRSENHSLLAWLTFARSVEPGFKHCPGNGSLSLDLVNAVSVFRDCDDEKLILWLEMARSCDNPSHCCLWT